MPCLDLLLRTCSRKEKMCLVCAEWATQKNIKRRIKEERSEEGMKTFCKNLLKRFQMLSPLLKLFNSFEHILFIFVALFWLIVVFSSFLISHSLDADCLMPFLDFPLLSKQFLYCTLAWMSNCLFRFSFFNFCSFFGSTREVKNVF